MSKDHPFFFPKKKILFQRIFNSPKKKKKNLDSDRII